VNTDQTSRQVTLGPKRGESPLTTQPLLTPHQSQYFAWLLTRRAAGDSVESLAATLVDAQVDLNPHQVDAALFACRNPLARGVLLADEVGLGKTIEAGLVISQRWAERRRNSHHRARQPAQAMASGVAGQVRPAGLILEAKSYNAIRKQEQRNPFLFASGPIICSYQFAKPRPTTSRALTGTWSCSTKHTACATSTSQATSSPRRCKEALAHVHPRCCSPPRRCRTRCSNCMAGQLGR
jgi:hypothetical protein